MEGLYLLIKTGYEGIDRVIFPSMDKDIVVNKINAFRNDIKQSVIEAKKVGLLDDSGTEPDNVDELLEKQPELYELHWKLNEDPDFYCIQQFKDDEFKCVCKELGVEPTKLMLR